MNLKLAQKKLNKINRLIDTFEPGESAVSRLERDLLLNYVRDLYEALMDEPDSTTTDRATKERIYKQSVEVRQRIEPKRSEVGKRLHFEEPQVHEPEIEDVIEKPAAAEPTSQEQISVTDILPQPKVQEPRSTKPKTEKKKAEVITSEQTTTIENNPEPEVMVTFEEAPKQEVEELFLIKKANEISEKLSQLPISDLNRAMGVNEKIFVKNELFAGDDNAFKQVIQKLNSMSSFEDAKSFLSSEVAYTYQWTDPEKKNKAKNFIQLVYRRYKDN